MAVLKSLAKHLLDTPPKININTENHGLEHVSAFKYGIILGIAKFAIQRCCGVFQSRLDASILLRCGIWWRGDYTVISDIPTWAGVDVATLPPQVEKNMLKQICWKTGVKISWFADLFMIGQRFWKVEENPARRDSTMCCDWIFSWQHWLNNVLRS